MIYGFTITSAGWRLLAKLLAGDRLNLTRVIVGSGRVPDGMHPGDLTGLIAPVALATSTAPVVVGKVVSFIVEYRSDLNGGLKEGFWLTEYGVYASDPDVGEILLYYGTLGDYPQYVTAYSDGSVDIRRYPVSIVLTDELEVTAAYPALAFMTSEDVEERLALLRTTIIAETEPSNQKIGDFWLDTSGQPGQSDPSGGGVMVLNAIVSDTEPDDKTTLWFDTNTSKGD